MNTSESHYSLNVFRIKHVIFKLQDTQSNSNIYLSHQSYPLIKPLRCILNLDIKKKVISGLLLEIQSLFKGRLVL